MMYVYLLSIIVIISILLCAYFLYNLQQINYNPLHVKNELELYNILYNKTEEIYLTIMLLLQNATDSNLQKLEKLSTNYFRSKLCIINNLPKISHILYKTLKQRQGNILLIEFISYTLYGDLFIQNWVFQIINNNIFAHNILN